MRFLLTAILIFTNCKKTSHSDNSGLFAGNNNLIASGFSKIPSEFLSAAPSDNPHLSNQVPTGGLIATGNTMTSDQARFLHLFCKEPGVTFMTSKVYAELTCADSNGVETSEVTALEITNCQALGFNIFHVKDSSICTISAELFRLPELLISHSSKTREFTVRDSQSDGPIEFEFSSARGNAIGGTVTMQEDPVDSAGSLTSYSPVAPSEQNNSIAAACTEFDRRSQAIWYEASNNKTGWLLSTSSTEIINSGYGQKLHRKFRAIHGQAELMGFIVLRSFVRTAYLHIGVSWIFDYTAMPNSNQWTPFFDERLTVSTYPCPGTKKLVKWRNQEWSGRVFLFEGESLPLDTFTYDQKQDLGYVYPL